LNTATFEMNSTGQMVEVSDFCSGGIRIKIGRCSY
jgi:hypothetical protein